LSRWKFMKPPAILFVPLFLLSAPAGEPDVPPVASREWVVRSSVPDSKARGYRAWFEKVGRAGLTDLMSDKDAGIALQAAWEAHKKPARRAKPVPSRVDDVYDPAELKKFVAFVKDRTKAPVPAWWTEVVIDVGVVPGRHHHFAWGGTHPTWKTRRPKAGEHMEVPDGAELERRGEALVYTAGGRSVEFPGAALAVTAASAVTAVFADKRSAVAVAFTGMGCPFKLGGFEGGGRKPVWVADVWAAGRTILTGLAPHQVELAEKGGTVFVFGAETCGAYLEAFDLATGKCLYRFCSGYWFHFSETWGLK
jgi:hypothetical protein